MTNDDREKANILGKWNDDREKANILGEMTNDDREKANQQTMIERKLTS